MTWIVFGEETGVRGFLGQSRRMFALAAGLAPSLTCACVAPASYMGISLLRHGALSEIQILAERAQGGDKQAQLDLGIAFEEGRGISRDLHKARALYRLAGSDSGQLWVYSPSPGNGAPSRVESIDIGPRQSGLPEAKARLARIMARRRNPEQ